MLNCIGSIVAKLPCLLALTLCACGSNSKPADSANSVVPLDEKPTVASPTQSSAESHTPSPDVNRAMKAIDAKQFAEAKEILTKAIGAKANDVLAHYYLGVASSGLGDSAGAEKSFQRAIELDPKFAEAYVNLSALQLDHKDAASALSTIDAGLKNTSHADLFLNRAIALESLGKKDEAAVAYGIAVEHMPDNFSLRVSYAQLLMANGKKSEALSQIRKVRESDDPKLLAIAAIVTRQLEAYADCVAILDRAIVIKDLAALRVRRGMCREDLKDVEGAKGDYERAIAIDQKFAPAHYYYGVMLQKSKDNKKACVEFAAAISTSGSEGVGPQAKKASAEIGCK